MLTCQEARKIAEAQLNTSSYCLNGELIIIESAIIEKEYAWIFPYTSKLFFETKDIRFAIGGNSPLFISKKDGSVSTYRTGLSIEGMIDEHEETHQLWNLILTETEPLSSRDLLVLKTIISFTNADLLIVKKSKLLLKGSKRHLLRVQQQLSVHNISSEIRLTDIR